MLDARDPRQLLILPLVFTILFSSYLSSNGWAADELERRGIRVRIEPVVEYLQYSDLVQLRRGVKKGLKAALKTRIRRRLVDSIQDAAAEGMGWPHHASIPEVTVSGSE